VFSIFGCIFIISGNITAFAVLYTLGNICMLGSTIFLVGPMRQLKNMFASTRIIATIMYILAIALTLVAAFVIKSTILVIFALIIQFVALTWYSLSYIPGARFIAKKCLGGCIDG